MKRYYYSIEDDAIISADELNRFRLESAPDMSLPEYIASCSYLQNGDIEPLTLYIARLKKAMAQHGKIADPDDLAFIMELTELAEEDYRGEL